MTCALIDVFNIFDIKFPGNQAIEKSKHSREILPGSVGTLSMYFFTILNKSLGRIQHMRRTEAFRKQFRGQMSRLSEIVTGRVSLTNISRLR